MSIKKSCFLFLFFLFFYFPAFSQQNTISLEASNMPLGEVIKYVEKNCGFLFTYKEEDIKGTYITVQAKNEDIHVFLNKILEGHFLEHEIINSNYVVLKKSEKIDLSKPENEPPLFCGSVVDSTTREPLPYAAVYFKKNKKGHYSDINGEFNFRSDFSKNDTVVVSYVGYGEKYFPADYFIKKPCPIIPLNYFSFSEDFIVVTDYLADGIDLADNGAATVIRPNRVDALPGQVEPDIFSTIQFLPGINSPSGEASGMYVRGGAADQNLILWEGIPIYHAAHFFGMISAFNPYIIDKATVYRGGFGAEYGGRVSSVINLQLADYTLRESQFGAGVNFINAYSHGQASIANGRGALVYSLRRSISELWRSPTFNNIALRNQDSHLQAGFDVYNLPKNFEVNDEFYFLDGHLKLSFQLSEKDDISAAYFYNKNDFNDNITDPGKKENQVNVLDLNSQGGSIFYNRKWTGIFSSKLLVTTSVYDYDYQYSYTPFPMTLGANRFGQKLNTVKENQFQLNNELKINNEHLLKFGYQHTNYNVGYHIKHEDDRRNQLLADEKEDKNSNVGAFYAEFNSSNKNKIGMDAGIRLSRFELRAENYISLRFQLWYKLTDDFTLQANAGKYRQYISQLIEFRGDNLGYDTPIWVINGDRDAPVLDAEQYQLGLIYNKNNWVLDVQFYTKKITGLTSLALGFGASVQKPEAGQSDGKGMDILVKKRWRNLRTWASYSLGKTDYHFDRFLDEDFAAPYDIRHAFQWAGQMTVGNFEFSLGTYLSSGPPYSAMHDFVRKTGANGRDFAEPVYLAFNDRRLPLQHRLDASVLYNFKSGKKLNGVVGLSFFNVYERDNVYAREDWVRTPPDATWSIETNDDAGLGLTPNMVVRLEW